MLTFDQSASVISFSPPAACEQELYKHVLPPREAKGSFLITGKAVRREALLLFDPLSGSGPNAGPCVTYARTFICKQKHTWQEFQHLNKVDNNWVLRNCSSIYFFTTNGRQPYSGHNSPVNAATDAFSSQTYFLFATGHGLETRYQTLSHLTTLESTASVAAERARWYPTPRPHIAALTRQKLRRHHSDPLGSSDWATDAVLTCPTRPLTGWFLHRGSWCRSRVQTQVEGFSQW